MWLIRSIFWFDKGELSEIAGKLTASKPGYETRWEGEVMFAFAFLVVLGFVAGMWLGLAALWLVKTALQALNKKRFFDPLP